MSRLEIAKAAEGEKNLLMLRSSIFSACSPAGDKNNETCLSPYTTSRPPCYSADRMLERGSADRRTPQ